MSFADYCTSFYLLRVIFYPILQNTPFCDGYSLTHLCISSNKNSSKMEINFKEIAIYVGIVFVGALAAVVAYSAYKEYQDKATATITTK